MSKSTFILFCVLTILKNSHLENLLSRSSPLATTLVLTGTIDKSRVGLGNKFVQIYSKWRFTRSAQFINYLK